MSLFLPPEELPTTVATVVPAKFRVTGEAARSATWVLANKPGQAVDCFLEGPSFDREGNLYVTDIPHGRIFKIATDMTWTLIAQYDGWPNGLRVHRDGRIFIADYKYGVILLDPTSGAIKPYLTHRHSESFKGCNDLTFDRKGRLYFTDQGQSGMHDPTGRVYLHDPQTGKVDPIITNGPSPNGLVLNEEETVLYVGMTRGNAVWRVPLLVDGSVTSKVGVFTALAGGVSGADGLALDEQGRVFVCDAGQGCVWVFTKFGEPVYRIRACTGGRTITNLAFGGPDRKSLFITDSSTGSILRAELDVPGRLLYSHH